MSKYEDLIMDLEDRYEPTGEAIQSAVDAMEFVRDLHGLLKETGVVKSEEPNVNELEQVFTDLNGELAAAALFFMEQSFSRVPDMLRVIGDRLAKEDDTNSVPPEVIAGFHRLAQRIENTRVAAQAVAKNEMGLDK